MNTYAWSTGAYQTEISYTSSAISGGPQTSDFTYDAAGNLSSVAIHDGTPSTIAYTTNAQGQITRRVETSSNSTNPKTLYYFFDGQQVGEVTNDGSEQVQDYAEAIAVRSAKAQEGPFANGGTGPTAYAAFGDAFQQITPTSQGSSTDTGSTYTVQAGDTLASVASKLWGDSSLWYLIADANGLSGSATLSAGQVLSIPAQVTNVHNNASTFHVYDPTQAVGDVQPLNPPPAQNSGGGCGIFGEILSIIVAVVLVGPVGAAISALVGFKAPFIPGAALAEGIEVAVGAKSSYSSKDVEAVAGEAANTFKDVVVTIANVAIDVATAAILAPLGPLGEAAGAALDSVVNQGIDIAAGLQKKFSWTQVAVSAVSAGVTDALGGYNPGASFATRAVAGAAAYVADSATEAALGEGSFGHDLEAGLPGLVGSTVGSAALGPIDNAIGATGENALTPLAEVGSAISGAAGAIAGAATQTALTGSNFGRNLEDQLPEAVASSIGGTIAGQIDQTPAVQTLQSAVAGFASPAPPTPAAIIAVPDPLQPPSYGEFLANYFAQGGDSSAAGPGVQIAQLSDAQEAAASGSTSSVQDANSEPSSTVPEVVVTARAPSHNFFGDLFSGNFGNLGNDFVNGNFFPVIKPAGVDGTYSNYFYYEPPTAAELNQLHQAQQNFRAVVENEVAPVVNRQLGAVALGTVFASAGAAGAVFAAPSVGAFALANAPTISTASLAISSEAAVPGSSFGALGTLGAISGGVAVGNATVPQIVLNKATGDAFEAEVINNVLPQTQTNIQPQITVLTNGPSGLKVRLDALGEDLTTGDIVLTDAKASQTAPLTPNQTIVYPELQTYGGTVVGQGKAPYIGGTPIPPTQVQIIRGP